MIRSRIERLAAREAEAGGVTDRTILPSPSNILNFVRNGNAAHLRRALVWAESGQLDLSLVRGTLAVRVREELARPEGKGNSLLRNVLEDLENNHEVEYPFPGQPVRVPPVEKRV